MVMNKAMAVIKNSIVILNKFKIIADNTTNKK